MKNLWKASILIIIGLLEIQAKPLTIGCIEYEPSTSNFEGRKYSHYYPFTANIYSYETEYNIGVVVLNLTYEDGIKQYRKKVAEFDDKPFYKLFHGYDSQDSCFYYWYSVRRIDPMPEVNSTAHYLHPTWKEHLFEVHNISFTKKTTSIKRRKKLPRLFFEKMKRDFLGRLKKWN